MNDGGKTGGLNSTPATGWMLLQTHSRDEGGMPGGSSVRGGEELKSMVGNTPGGLSTGCIDSSCDESPTTSAHP